MIELTHDELEACTGYYEAKENQVIKYGESGYHTNANGTTYIIQCGYESGEYCLTTINVENINRIFGISPYIINAN